VRGSRRRWLLEHHRHLLEPDEPTSPVTGVVY
jgi:hypothetical protein